MDTIEKSLQREAHAKADSAAQTNDGNFWGDKTALPQLPNTKIASALDDSDLDALHKAMRSISYTAIDELRAVADIEEMYDFLTQNQ